MKKNILTWLFVVLSSYLLIAQGYTEHQDQLFEQLDIS